MRAAIIAAIALGMTSNPVVLRGESAPLASRNRVVASTSVATTTVYGRIVAIEAGDGMLVIRRKTRDYFLAISSATKVVRGSTPLTIEDLAPGQAVIARCVETGRLDLAIQIHVEPIVVLPPARR